MVVHVSLCCCKFPSVLPRDAWLTAVQMLLIGFYTVLGFPTNLSWWAFLLAIAISFGFALPIGIIQAVTNTQIGLNVLTEFIYGYLQPGRPLALMMYVDTCRLYGLR